MTIDGDLYRKVLGRCPTGVTLVTGMDEAEPLAIVIGSFTSVSMSPPLVGFFIGTGSQTWQRIEKSGSFGVNILSDEQADLSNGFFQKERDPWEETEWEPMTSGSPMIPSCLANIDCSIHEVSEAGDHFFVSGLVEEAIYRDVGSPLVFLGGKYGQFQGAS